MSRVSTEQIAHFLTLQAGERIIYDGNAAHVVEKLGKASRGYVKPLRLFQIVATVSGGNGHHKVGLLELFDECVPL